MAFGIHRNTSSLRAFRRKISLLRGASLKETDKVASAIVIQDSIREKGKKWNSTAELRKWREAR